MNTPLFISYRSLEQDFALKLARDLLQVGYPVWMDRLHGILPGDEWRCSLEQGVNKAAALLACLSRNYMASTWCRRELQRADSLKKPIFPVLIGPIADDQWPLEIQDKQYADFQNWTDATAYQAALAELLAGIEKKDLLKPGPPCAIPPPETPDPARDDPEDQAERGIAQVTRLETAGGFAAIEAEELRKDMDLWMKMYRAAALQRRMLVDDAAGVRLEMQLENYKIKWEELEKRLHEIEVRRAKPPNSAIADPNERAVAPGRLALDLLNQLLYAQFQEVAFRYQMPLQHLPQNVAQSQQAIAVIQYALQKEGEDLEQLLKTIYQVAPHLPR